MTAQSYGVIHFYTSKSSISDTSSLFRTLLIATFFRTSPLIRFDGAKFWYYIVA